MLEFICLFFPAVFATFVTESILKQDFAVKKSIYISVTYALAINTVIFALKYFAFKTSASPLSSIYGMTVHTAFKYLVLAIPLAFIFAVIGAVIAMKSGDNKKDKKK